MTKSTKFCRHCGAKIPANSEFCEKCGKELTPKREDVTPPHVTVPKTRMRKVSLAILIIALASTSLVALSIVPNSLIKNSPWIDIEWVTINSFGLFEGVIVVAFFFAVSIHNPTHHTYRVEVTGAELDANVTSRGRHFLFSVGMGGFAMPFPQIFQNGNWTEFFSTELPACSPILVGLNFERSTSPPTYQHFPTVINKGMFHLTLAVTIDGSKTTLSNDFSTDFAGALIQTSTNRMAPETSKSPDECLFPWV